MKAESHHGDSYAYGYDKTSQLLNVNKNGSLFESFSYDKNGNRIVATGPTAGVYTTTIGNRYATDGTFTYTYDDEGNTKTKTEIVTGEVTEYVWDYRNRLTKLEQRSPTIERARCVRRPWHPALPRLPDPRSPRRRRWPMLW